jgi:hypothetical protein
MKCTLCKTKIENYDFRFNHLAIDESHAAEICLSCIRKITTWQQGTYAALFPTKAAKDLMKKRRNKPGS